MSNTPDILCIGSVLWDTIGQHPHPMRLGDDRPGKMTIRPGGVALNVAMTLVRFGLRPGVLTFIGTDDEGDRLVEACQLCSVDTTYALRHGECPTDRYMAIEGSNGLIAAIADAHSLEAAGDAILEPLSDGRIATAEAPFDGPVALDGNLKAELLSVIAESDLFARADLRVVPASPGKARRLRPLLALTNATMYLNLEEAEVLADTSFRSTAEAASHLVRQGCARVLVTHGAQATTDAGPDHVLTRHPPTVEARQITGAGDTFMAAHIAAETRGHGREYALEAALQAAATHVAGDLGG